MEQPPLPNWRPSRHCVCSVDNEPGERFSVCGLPCRARRHLPDYLREQIALYDAWQAQQQA